MPTRIATDAKRDMDHARHRMRFEVPRDPGETVRPERSPQTHRGPALLLDDRDFRVVLMFPFGQRPVAEIPMDAKKRSSSSFDFVISKGRLARRDLRLAVRADGSGAKNKSLAKSEGRRDRSGGERPWGAYASWRDVQKFSECKGRPSSYYIRGTARSFARGSSIDKMGGTEHNKLGK